jgi:hypothetical protein
MCSYLTLALKGIEVANNFKYLCVNTVDPGFMTFHGWDICDSILDVKKVTIENF